MGWSGSPRQMFALHFVQHLKEFTTSESCSSCLTGTPGSNTGLEVGSNLHENSETFCRWP